ncbi:MAG: hypothetical protein HY275_04685 [Gemmatimonadetes bacterium]|nr:hypothetical protein [Gemmatimonadota bacterium]
MNHAAALAAARRALGALPGAIAATTGGAPLDLPRDADERPRVERTTALEPAGPGARVVPPLAGPHTRAFLDGVQRTERVGYLMPGHLPVVHASCAAIIRVRDADGRLHTWADALVRDDALYAPLALLDADARAALEALALAGHAVRDSLADGGGSSGATPGVAPHPLALDRAALDAVRTTRARLERELADRWVASGDGWLWVDGPLPGDATRRAPNAFGVIKSHQTLYAEGDALAQVLALRAGERSRAFVHEGTSRVRVASWYVRLRDGGGAGPFHGLVRIEAALGSEPTAAGARADEVSALVLAERQPLSRPDPRWDVMAYPIRDAEQVLRAVL